VAVDRGLREGFRIPHDREIEQVPLCDTARVSDARTYVSKDTVAAASKHLDRS
jgi:hypothetical protein